MVAGPELPAEPPGPERVVDDVPYASPRRGRPKKARSETRMQEVLHLYFVERLSMRKVAEVVGMSHMSVYRMLSDPNVELLL
jgi:transposase